MLHSLAMDDPREPTHTIQLEDGRMTENDFHHHRIVNQIGEGVAAATLDGFITFVNEAWAAMHGYTREELIGTHLAVFHSPRQLMEEVEPFNEIVRETGRYQGEVGHITKGGREFQTLMTTTVLRDDRNTPPEMVAIARDITATKKTEEEVTTRGRYLRCLSTVSQILLERRNSFAVFPEILRLLGETAVVSRTYIFANNTGPNGELRCRQVASWTGADAPPVPEADSEIQDFPYAANGFGRWAEKLGAGSIIAGTVADFPKSERLRLEPYRIKSLLLIPLWVSDQWYGYIGFDCCDFVRAWTEQEVELLKVAATELSAAIENHKLLERLRRDAAELESRVADRTAELSAVNRELEAFAYSVSHDLRAPLRTIDGFSKALLEDCGDSLGSQGTDHIDRVRAGVAKMRALIDNMLRLSRITQREMVLEEVNLGAMAQSILEEMIQDNPARQAEISIADDLKAIGDAALLRSVLENLLGNAWKFTALRRTTHIDFRASMAPDGLIFRIKDNGAGFDMRYADRLFSPFQRLHPETEYDGTGIGLATVQRIIHRHGGRVWAEGAVNQGTSFFFTLQGN